MQSTTCQSESVMLLMPVKKPPVAKPLMRSSAPLAHLYLVSSSSTLRSVGAPEKPSSAPMSFSFSSSSSRLVRLRGHRVGGAVTLLHVFLKRATAELRSR